MTVQGRWLKPQLRHDGYYQVNVHREDQQLRLIVHRAVAAAWLPAPAPTHVEINHKDARKTNNAPANLEWCTPRENRRHAMALGLMKYHTPARKAAARRLGASKRKLTDQQINLIRSSVASGASITSQAKQYGVAWLTVARIQRGETYRSETDGV